MTTIADVNRDGWLDIISPIYKDTLPHPTRKTMSPIWLGGPGGFDPSRRILLPTDSGTGAIASDFNADGHVDVFFYCHRIEGDINRIDRPGEHMANSFLYWGSADGFDPARRLELSGEGVHSDNGMDLGDVYSRGFVFTYISSPHEYQGRPARLDWTAHTPHRSRVRFQVRTAESREMLERAEWVGPDGAASYFTKSPASLNVRSGTFLQYRAELDTDTGAYSPVVDTVEIRFAERWSLKLN